MPAKEKVEFNRELFAAMVAAQPLNKEKAEMLAERFGVKPKSVIAKAVREKLTYEKQVRVRKDGKPVASKDATVAEVEARLGLADGALDGLEKAAKVALERLRDALPEVEDEAE